MRTATSVWKPFRSLLPTFATERPIDMVRFNAQSIAQQAICEMPFGWNYTNSVTRGEAAPGTAAHPAVEYFTRGSGINTLWLKRVLTWTGNVITKVAYYYSSNNEANYVPMYDEDGINYVLTLTYDGSFNLTETSWGNTP